MSPRNFTNFVYYSAKNEKQDTDEKSKTLDQKTLDKLLKTLASQSMREKTPTLEELQGILQGNVQEQSEE